MSGYSTSKVGAYIDYHRRRYKREYNIYTNTCIKCEGSGKRMIILECSECNGTGKVNYCQNCNGTGGLFGLCSFCNGVGRVGY